MKSNLKQKFGKLLREARDARGLSRARLSTILGISPKTIQSWEMGRTFIEKLDLIPKIEAALLIDFTALFSHTLANLSMNESDSRLDAAPFRSDNSGKPKTSTQNRATNMENEWVRIPLLKASAILKAIPDWASKDIEDQVVVPMEWTRKHTGRFFGVRVRDESLKPRAIMDDIAVLIQEQDQSCERLDGSVALLKLSPQNWKFGQIKKAAEGWMISTAACKGRRSMPFDSAKGHAILGRVIGVFSQF